MTAFIRFPWATSGEKEAVPATTQPDGAVSLQEGYGDDYSRDIRSDPAARSVERTKFNGFMNLLSSGLRFLQINGGYPEFISTTDNGGTPFAYANGVRVRFDDGTGYKTYQSRKDNNISLPTVAADWFLVDDTTGVPAGQITNSSIAMNAAIDASKIANGTVSNTEFQYLDGVSSNIQTQLDGKQPAGDYITGLTGDVTTPGGGGSVAATLANTSVVAGTYSNAEIQVDSKGRVVSAKAGGSPFGIVDDFETWVAGLPTGLPWSSAQAAQISQSASHVTNGTRSCQFSASGAVTMSATVPATQFAQYGELVVDVFIQTMAVGQRATISCGANSNSTPNGVTGTFQLRVQVPNGATTTSLAVSGASQVWFDNLRYVTKINATGIDGLGTAALVSPAASRIVARLATGDVGGQTLSDVLDLIGGATQGDIIYRGASVWTRLAAGTAGQALISGGPSANPSWGNSNNVFATVNWDGSTGNNISGTAVRTGGTGTWTINATNVGTRVKVGHIIRVTDNGADELLKVASIVNTNSITATGASGGAFSAAITLRFCAIRNAIGVDSVVYKGVGYYVINFTNAQPNEYWAAQYSSYLTPASNLSTHTTPRNDNLGIHAGQGVLYAQCSTFQVNNLASVDPIVCMATFARTS